MMVPGILGKYGRAYDQFTGMTDLTSKDRPSKIIENFGFVISRLLTSYMPGADFNFVLNITFNLYIFMSFFLIHMIRGKTCMHGKQ